MSRDIIIQEGGQGKQLSVDKLRTNLVGGGTCLWVPEDEVALGKKTITRDGTYKAVDDDLYGYSKVTVKGIGKATGKLRPGDIPRDITDGLTDGKEFQVTAQPDGTLQITQLPVAIKIKTPPTVVEYGDGAIIDFTGMEVLALSNATGEDIWTDADHPDGIVTIPELTLSETEADMDKAARRQEYPDYAASGAYRINSVGSILQAIDDGMARFRADVNDGGILQYIKNAVAQYEGVYPAVVRVSVDAGYQSAYMGWSPFDVCVLEGCNVGDTITLGQSVQGRHVRVYANGGSGKLNFVDYQAKTSNTAAIIGVSPETSGHGVYISSLNALNLENGTQEIPVQWARPGDGKVLETSFRIRVTSAE